MVNFQEMEVFRDCKVKDWPNLQSKIEKMVKAGPQRLQLVSDFDYTITKQHTDDGSQVLSSFGIFERSKSLPKNFKDGAVKLFNKYRPIEIDPHIPLEEKVTAMIEWWTLSGQLLKGFHFHQEEIDEIAEQNVHCLRERTKELFDTLHRLEVPVLVFSAGLGHSVMAVLRLGNVLHPNMKVISNFLHMAEDGTVDGFAQPMIHTFNKNETILKGSDYYNLVLNHDNVILMGDSLADANMANGVSNNMNIIKIGFLYERVEDNLQRYMDTFDMVLVDDQTMNVPLALIELIERAHTAKALD